MNIDIKRLMVQSKAFHALNGRSMTISDFIRKTTDDERLAELIELFNMKDSKEILCILKRSVEELPNLLTNR